MAALAASCRLKDTFDGDEALDDNGSFPFHYPRVLVPRMLGSKFIVGIRVPEPEFGLHTVVVVSSGLLPWPNTHQPVVPGRLSGGSGCG
jgi:hypothetical protein